MNVLTPGQADRPSKLKSNSLFVSYLVTGRTHPNFGFWPLYSRLFLLNFSLGSPSFFWSISLDFYILCPTLVFFTTFTLTALSGCTHSLCYLSCDIWRPKHNVSVSDRHGLIPPLLIFNRMKVEIRTIWFNSSLSVLFFLFLVHLLITSQFTFFFEFFAS